MTAALKSGAAQRKSSRSAKTSRRKNSPLRLPPGGTVSASKGTAQGETQPNSAKVVPLRQTIAKDSTLKDRKQNEFQRRNSSQSTVRTLPQPEPLPLWLRGLFALQQGSSVIMLLLVMGGMGVYGWTVYTQQRWGDAFQRLENLQKRERQYLTTNEVLKNQMAKQAEAPDTGLVPPDPNSTIFLSPAPLRPAATPEVQPSPDTPIPARPLGY
ncbi:hypothetical protein [Leptolyngbya ohadii]|uniref:hypothetical protein n=1 Tax=Leptolyngbya ohadii TaxID=1962290 RepID=UPI000B59E7F2|nr:hypothetical protein [Leptolyngbya ohadii]